MKLRIVAVRASAGAKNWGSRCQIVVPNVVEINNPRRSASLSKIRGNRVILAARNCRPPHLVTLSGLFTAASFGSWLANVVLGKKALWLKQ